MTTDLSRMPFSRFGSYITVVEHREEGLRRPKGLATGIWLSGVHGFHSGREAFRLGLWRAGAELPLTAEALPAFLTLRADGASVDLCIAKPECVRLRCQGAELRLHLREGRYNYVIPQSPMRWLVNPSQACLLYTVDCLSGALRVEPGVLVVTPADGGTAELVLHQHVGFANPEPVTDSFDQAVAAVAAEFDAFAAPYRHVNQAWRETAERAAWLNWSCVVGPRGHFQRPSMLMSKNWMTNVWSWDHAINALALGQAHPELAWDQLLTIFDHQLPTGQLPDFVNDAVRLYSYVKPPIHGWVLSRLLASHGWFADAERLAAFYEPLSRWTDWWCRCRMPGGSPLPEYYHGNDSGWDNGTVFDVGSPVAGPDAAAFLILQMEALADLADRLGRAAEAVGWRQRAAALLPPLMACWDGRRFRVADREGRICPQSDSVFGCLPIILGKRLPAPVRQALADEIRRHLTEWGVATEHPASPLYQAEGYWRGPIWAPPTLILFHGLTAAGETALANDLAHRFLRLCRQSGFAENFEATTGAPLCDPAYTWTASVFLDLAIWNPYSK